MIEPGLSSNLPSDASSLCIHHIRSENECILSLCNAASVSQDVQKIKMDATIEQDECEINFAVRKVAKMTHVADKR